MNEHFLKLIGGSALLLFSMEQLARSLQYLAGTKFRAWLNMFARNRLTGVLLGFFLSLIMSSSSAVTVMLVGLANSRLLTLKQVMSLSLGAAVGSTLFVQLMTLKLSTYSYLLIAGAVTLTTIFKSEKLRRIGKGILYLGLIFAALTFVVEASYSLKENEFFRFTINYFKDQTHITFFFAAVLSAVLHSAIAVVAIFISLMPAMDLSVSEAVPWVLGANLGTTTTAFFASLQGEARGKQAAIANFLIRLTGIVLIYPFMDVLADAAIIFSLDPGRQTAHVHTIFNLMLLFAFFPFIDLGAKLIEKIVKVSDSPQAFSYSFIDNRSIDTPEVALAQAQREILRLSDIVEQMVSGSIELFENPDKERMNAIRSQDKIVDFLNKGIRLFLTRMSQNEMTPEQVQKEFELFMRTNDLETIGDTVDKGIIGLARKNMKKGYSFSKEGWRDLKEFHAKTLKCLELSNAYFTSGDKSLAVRLSLLHDEMDELIIEMTEQHVARLHKGVKEAVQTTSVHLDLLGYLHSIAKTSVQFMRFRISKTES